MESACFSVWYFADWLSCFSISFANTFCFMLHDLVSKYEPYVDKVPFVSAEFLHFLGTATKCLQSLIKFNPNFQWEQKFLRQGLRQNFMTPSLWLEREKQNAQNQLLVLAGTGNRKSWKSHSFGSCNTRIWSPVCLSFAVICNVKLLHRPTPPRRLNAQGGVLAHRGSHQMRGSCGNHHSKFSHGSYHQHHHARGSHLARMGYPTQT